MATKRVASSEVSMDELVFKTKVVFKVNSFSQLPKQDIYSDVFNMGSDEWCVSVQFKVEDNSTFVGIFLELVKSLDNKTIDAQFNVFIMDTNCDRQRLIGTTKRPYSEMDSNWGFKQFYSYDSLITQMDQLLPNNTLTIGLNITSYKSFSFGSISKRIRFEDNFNNKHLNDCRLVVNGKEFFASKLLLSDRSEVFRQMFLTDMSEKASNEVVIDDIKADVFEEFLRFLYFGNSDKMDEMAEQLLYVSDKYMVDDLKTHCLNLFYMQINAKNAFEVLEVMDKYGNEELKAKTIEFINDNVFECLENKWHKIVGNNNKLIGQLVSGVKTTPKPKKATEIMSYSYLSAI